MVTKFPHTLKLPFFTGILLLFTACGNDTDSGPDLPEYGDEMIDQTETDNAQIRLYETESGVAGQSFGDERLQIIGSAERLFEGVDGRFAVQIENPESLRDGTFRLEVQTYHGLPLEDVTGDIMEFLADEFDKQLTLTTEPVTRYKLQIVDKSLLEEHRNYDTPPEINRTERRDEHVELHNASLDHIAKILQSEFEYEIIADDSPGFRINRELELTSDWDHIIAQLEEVGLTIESDQQEREIRVVE